MEIRRFQSSDSGEVRELVQRSVNTIDSGYSDEEIQHLRDVIPDLIVGFARSDDCTYFVAEEDEMLGVAGLFDQDSEVSGIFVDPDQISQGIGTRLMETLEEETREREADSLKAEAALTAEDFYLEIGFHRVERSSLEIEGKDVPVITVEKDLT